MGRFLGFAALALLAAFWIPACGPAPQSRAPSRGPAPATSPSPSTVPTPDVPAAASTPSPTSTTTTVPNVTSPAGSLYRCLVSQLSLRAGVGNAAAGTVGLPFVFTNTSRNTCALYGYPGLQRLDAGGQPLPTKVVWTPGPEQTVTLAPGGTASFLAWWHDQTGYSSPCAASHQVEVTPPNAYSHLTIPLVMEACPDGTVNVNAVTAGSTGGQPG